MHQREMSMNIIFLFCFVNNFGGRDMNAIKEFDNGCNIPEARDLTIPDSISARTLEDMDKAVSNFKIEKVSEGADLSDF